MVRSHIPIHLNIFPRLVLEDSDTDRHVAHHLLEDNICNEFDREEVEIDLHKGLPLGTPPFHECQLVIYCFSKCGSLINSIPSALLSLMKNPSGIWTRAIDGWDVLSR
jgi:hypothetical protein